MDAVIATTKAQFDAKKDYLVAAFYMINKRKKDKKILDEFSGRWSFMKSILENVAEKNKNETPR